MLAFRILCFETIILHEDVRKHSNNQVNNDTSRVSIRKRKIHLSFTGIRSLLWPVTMSNCFRNNDIMVETVSFIE